MIEAKTQTFTSDCHMTNKADQQPFERPRAHGVTKPFAVGRGQTSQLSELWGCDTEADL